MQREPGFYWVRIRLDWIIAEWNEVGKWQETGDWQQYEDSRYNQIDERRVIQFFPIPSLCEHDFTGTDKNGFTICSKCGEGYT